MNRQERMLIVVALLVLAAVILYETLHAPDMYPTSAPQTTAAATASTSVSRFAVDLNSASVEELMGVRGMREELAQNIVRDRAENGLFESPEDVLRVPGIGPATFEKMRPYLTAE